jgi:NADH:ubiquinone oxidoreductase subunit 6 (subunit J)
MSLFYILSFISILSAVLLVTNKNPVYSVLNLVLLFLSGSILLLFLGVDFIPFVFVVVYVGAVAVLFLFVVMILDIKLSANANNIRQLPYIFFVTTFVLLFLNSTSQSALCNESLEVESLIVETTTEYFTPSEASELMCHNLRHIAKIQGTDDTPEVQNLANEAKRIIESLCRFVPEDQPLSSGLMSKLHPGKSSEVYTSPHITSNLEDLAAQAPKCINSAYEPFYNDSGTNISTLHSLGQQLFTEYVIHFVIGGLVLLVALVGAIVLTSKSGKTSLKQKVFKQSERLHIVGKNK